jgi:hypothetical protein
MVNFKNKYAMVIFTIPKKKEISGNLEEKFYSTLHRDSIKSPASSILFPGISQLENTIFIL